MTMRFYILIGRFWSDYEALCSDWVILTCLCQAACHAALSMLNTSRLAKKLILNDFWVENYIF